MESPHSRAMATPPCRVVSCPYLSHGFNSSWSSCPPCGSVFGLHRLQRRLAMLARRQSMPAERSEGRSFEALNTNPQGGLEEQEVRETNNRAASKRKLALVRSEPPSFRDAQYGVAPFT